MLLAMLVAAAVSFASTPMVKALACKVGAIDVPKDNRRMHKVPIPRMGGLAIFLAFLLSVLVFADIDRQMQGILLGSIMIVILGVLDDIMALKALPKLFDVFYRSDSSRNNPNKGSGLGLAITSKILERFGGSIHAENLQPKGLRIVMTIPKEEQHE